MGEWSSQRIRQRMQEKGWGISELAREAGVAKGYLWELLQPEGNKRPGARTLYNLAQALGTSVADLLDQPPAAGAEAAYPVPSELQALAEAEGLTPEDVAMLAAIRFRGQQPKTRDDWRFLLDSIRRSVRS